ncbi:hypothetical protein NDU88_006931 [Pleurodeles waltl]|uniref:Uncharacterized protein n=1 Tax=Pleurodeles waltl TaxID=8319 RepID=A0AAV7UR16_PLEWA|nr:hypothetical protein NDU88_006931 [Pleurodeles waltl]
MHINRQASLQSNPSAPMSRMLLRMDFQSRTINKQCRQHLPAAPHLKLFTSHAIVAGGEQTSIFTFDVRVTLDWTEVGGQKPCLKFTSAFTVVQQEPNVEADDTGLPAWCLLKLKHPEKLRSLGNLFLDAPGSFSCFLLKVAAAPLVLSLRWCRTLPEAAKDVERQFGEAQARRLPTTTRH